MASICKLYIIFTSLFLGETKMARRAPFNRCVECDDIITNPICSYCLASQMKVMVGECNRKLAKKIAGFTVEGNTTCLSCGRKMGLCAHCFSRDIHQYLQENDALLAVEFLRRFDFELRKDFVDRSLRI